MYKTHQNINNKGLYSMLMFTINVGKGNLIVMVVQTGECILLTIGMH